VHRGWLVAKVGDFYYFLFFIFFRGGSYRGAALRSFFAVCMAICGGETPAVFCARSLDSGCFCLLSWGVTLWVRVQG
jgi:hypothetical protein